MLLSQKLRVVFDYAMITLGSLIAAIGLGLFNVEADVVPGGVTGIAMTINFLFPQLTVGLLIILLNIPLFLWGIWELGKAFGVRTLYGFVSNAFFIDLIRGDIPVLNSFRFQETAAIQALLEHDFFFFMFVGSIFIGIGLGLVFKFKGTTAGTEIVCAIIKKRFGISPGVSMMAVDFFVIAAATVVLAMRDSGDKPAMALAFYALFSLYLSSWLIDRVVYGFDYAKNVMIFSNKNAEISDYIIKHLDRGVTSFYARGMYTGIDKEVLMTIVSPSDARDLAPHIRAIDPNDFLIVSNVHEVLGEGFRSREDVDLKFVKTMQKREAAEAAAKAAQEAIRAEMAAKAADVRATHARAFANDYGTVHHVETAHADAQSAEDAAREAHDLAQKARAHAIELEEVASSIEACVSLDADPIPSRDDHEKQQ